MHRRSIKTKLILLATISGIAAVAVASTSFVLNDLVQLRESKWAQLRATAAILAANAAPALEAQDTQAAHQLLRSLASQPCIESAALYDEQHRLWVSLPFNGQAATESEPTLDNESLGERTTSTGDYVIHYPVAVRGARLGTLGIRANSRDVAKHLAEYLTLAMIVAICSALLSVHLAIILQRRLAEPIVRLAAFAHQIACRGDYSVRIEYAGNDEIGDLYGAFDSLLEKVEASETALLLAQSQLADRVGERTNQLLEEMDQRRRVQTELVAAQNETEVAQRVKQNFLAEKSFEIRTPLNALVGFSDLLSRGEVRDEHERQNYTDIVATSARNLATLLNDLLDLSEVAGGQLRVERQPCSPAEVIAEVVSLLQPAALEAGLTLDSVWQEHLPESIVTDRARLRQALLSVVGYCLRHARRGRVQLVARAGDIEGHSRLQVRLTAPLEHRSVAHDTAAPPARGTKGSQAVDLRYSCDLGMATACRIARALGGDLVCDDSGGNNRAFVLTVDAGTISSRIALESPSGDIVAAAPQPPTRPNLQGARILVADDGDANRRLIQVLLTRAGAKVAVAADGQQAVELALAEAHDLILMDMQMPVLDGYDATAKLRQAGIATPIVALTAHALQSDEAKCRAAGCSDYLTKPIEPQRLLEQVDRLLSRSPEPAASAPQALPTCSVELPAMSAAGPLRSSLPQDDQEFREIVGEFVDRFNQRLGEMRDVLGTGDLHRLGELAHWLKGCGGTAGFAQLSDVASELLSASRDSNASQADRVLNELEVLATRIESPQVAPPIADASDTRGGGTLP
ncbi:MAG: response regulator [Pirellulales bacterium]|nr:response regulator [Pirellulales bacterium]